MSEKEMKERFVFKNIEVLRQFEEKKQSIIIIMGHYSSWEWMLSWVTICPSKVMQFILH